LKIEVDVVQGYFKTDQAGEKPAAGWFYPSLAGLHFRAALETLHGRTPSPDR
jgi:hypothetical protein